MSPPGDLSPGAAKLGKINWDPVNLADSERYQGETGRNLSLSFLRKYSWNHLSFRDIVVYWIKENRFAETCRGL